MVFILSKLLLFLIKPFTWIIIIFLIAFFTKNVIQKKKLFAAGLFLSLFFSNNFIVGKVLNFYEAQYPPKANYDFGILLGGFSGVNNRNKSVQFNGASDRLLQTISLYKNGVIKKILITSGNANLVNKDVKEADLVLKYLKEIGIPDTAIFVENQSRNTIENAKLSFKLINQVKPAAKVLVITSAWHIPRAKLIFSKYFVDANYYPTNFIGKTAYDLSDYLIPNVYALGDWELLFKEWVGLLVDKFRG